MLICVCFTVLGTNSALYYETMILQYGSSSQEWASIFISKLTIYMIWPSLNYVHLDVYYHSQNKQCFTLTIPLKYDSSRQEWASIFISKLTIYMIWPSLNYVHLDVYYHSQNKQCFTLQNNTTEIWLQQTGMSQHFHI